ncbi:hypothetical protein FB446DRAFT_807439 [Lentinula raphanica]|nr:hypothetical protein FB446DRAFT_807439 [Lentinula raphanica]
MDRISKTTPRAFGLCYLQQKKIKIFRTSTEGNDAIQELLRVNSQTSQAQENQRKRRLAWEVVCFPLAFPPSLLNYLPTKHKRRWTPTVIQFRSVEAKPEDSDRRSNAQTYTSLNGFGTFLVSAFDQSYTICVVKQTLSVQGGPEGTELLKVITKEKKFESRAAAWLRILILEHTTFNGALPLDCMSSEESDHEADSSQLETTYGEAAVSYDSFTLLIRRIQVVPKRGWTKMNRAIGTYWPPTEWSFELDDKSALDSCYGG